MELLFWIALAIVVYTYLGYPLVLYALVKLKKSSPSVNAATEEKSDWPAVTLIVACYNEADILSKKIDNTLGLDYSPDKRHLFFVTDGSTDESGSIIQAYPELKYFHQDGRQGKNAAVNRVMKFVSTPITIFCDANTFLNKDALKLMVNHFREPAVGAVAGEKRVMQTGEENAANSGEGAYWKYESMLKRWDSQLHTVVGAAGELFAIRTELYEEVPPGVLIEDFRLSMNIAKKGHRVIYEPNAYAMETSSESMEEEHKRKVRISAGGLIEVWYFLDLLNIFKYGWLSFQYVSHRMLRWTLAPLSLLFILVSNFYLAITDGLFYQGVLLIQLSFYATAFIGHALRNKKIKWRILFVPYYFVFMNLSVFQGLLRLLRGKQTAIWDKAKRAEIQNA
jgi:poly-beta-1,6-N-acetyl-D-glucosamine synthase